MRISDWSSDVCSSDLQRALRALEQDAAAGAACLVKLEPDRRGIFENLRRDRLDLGQQSGAVGFRRTEATAQRVVMRQQRSEERRVGQEWVRTCRSRWAPDH